MTKIAVIGGGLSGLTVATLLKNDADITVFEKARGVSGRLSTRRADPYAFDHGAQYFTVRNQAFRDFLAPLEKAGFVRRWEGHSVKLDGKERGQIKDCCLEDSRFVGAPSMNIVAKILAQDLSVEVKTRISSIKKKEKWALFNENKACLGDFDWVVSTAPAPQTLEIIPEDFKYFQSVKKIQMEPCFCLMLGFSSPLPLGFDAAHVINSDIEWIAVNSRKPGRQEQSFALVIHSTPQYAHKHIEDDPEKILQHLSAEASHITGQALRTADHKALHRWKFARSPHSEAYPPFIDERLKIGVCGDWVCGGRVEGAFVSAKNLSQKIKFCLA